MHESKRQKVRFSQWNILKKITEHKPKFYSKDWNKLYNEMQSCILSKQNQEHFPVEHACLI